MKVILVALNMRGILKSFSVVNHNIFMKKKIIKINIVPIKQSQILVSSM